MLRPARLVLALGRLAPVLGRLALARLVLARLALILGRLALARLALILGRLVLLALVLLALVLVLDLARLALILGRLALARLVLARLVLAPLTVRLTTTVAAMRRGGSGSLWASWNAPWPSGSALSRQSACWPNGTGSGRGRRLSSSGPWHAPVASESSISQATLSPARLTRCCHSPRNSPGRAWPSASGPGASAAPGMASSVLLRWQ